MTSDDYAPCLILSPDRTVRRGNVRYIRLDSVESALRKLQAGQIAWVLPAAYAAICESDPTWPPAPVVVG